MAKRGAPVLDYEFYIRLFRAGTNIEPWIRLNALIENTGLLHGVADYMCELGIWMEDCGLPFSSIIHEGRYTVSLSSAFHSD